MNESKQSYNLGQNIFEQVKKGELYANICELLEFLPPPLRKRKEGKQNFYQNRSLFKIFCPRPWKIKNKKIKVDE